MVREQMDEQMRGLGSKRKEEDLTPRHKDTIKWVNRSKADRSLAADHMFGKA